MTTKTVGAIMKELVMADDNEYLIIRHGISDDFIEMAKVALSDDFSYIEEKENAYLTLREMGVFNIKLKEEHI